MMTALKEGSDISIRNKITALLFLVACFLYKPTILGCNLTPVGMILCVALIFLKQRLKITLSNSVFPVIGVILLFYTYRFIKSWFETGLQPDYYKAALSICCILITAAVVLHDPKVYLFFVKSFCILLCLFTVSYFITLIIGTVKGSYSSLVLLRYDIPNYENYTLTLVFPFTPVSGTSRIFGIVFPRLASLYRECGITQAFYIWALSESDFCFKKNLLIKFLLFSGTLLCFSTTGYICLLVYLLLQILVKDAKIAKSSLLNKIGLITLLAVIFYFYYNMEELYLGSKNNISFNARFGTLVEMWEVFKSNPLLGVGGSNLKSSNTFLQIIHQIGIIGVFLYGLIYYTIIKNAESKKRVFISCSALLITMIFAQPIADTPLVFLFVYLASKPYCNQGHAPGMAG